MLTSVATVKAISIPIVAAVLLVFLFRQSAPTWRSLATFLFGGWGAFSLNSAILRSLPSVLPPDQLFANTPSQAFLSAFVEAAIPEEFAKGIWILLLLFVWRRYFSRHAAYIGGLVGLGFAMRENLAYAQTAEEWRVLAVFCHGAWGAIAGHLLQGAIDTTPLRLWKFLWAIVPSILLHGLLNTTIFLVEVYDPTTVDTVLETDPNDDVSPALLIPMLGTCAVAIVSWVWAIKNLQLNRRQLQNNAVLISKNE